MLAKMFDQAGHHLWSISFYENRQGVPFINQHPECNSSSLYTNCKYNEHIII
jgi:hypothetical protein